jgi:hypothetical protein
MESDDRAARKTAPASLSAPALSRCADAAQTRGETITASAVPYRRYLLIEVPGSWGQSALDERNFDPGTARRLTDAAADADLNVLLIRRPGRPAEGAAGAANGGPRAWALADTRPGTERVQWGSWTRPEDLRDLDLAADIPVTAARSGPQRLALICTNGKRDLCCAVRGRPVAHALAATGSWDSWECSHLGGHRFAATMMLLPTGDMFGWLDPHSAVAVVERFDAGQFLLPHYRGRSGQPLPVQAALHAAAVRLGDSRRQAFEVTLARRLPPGPCAPAGDQPAEADRWEVVVRHQAQPGHAVTYRVTVAGAVPSPALLSCSDDLPRAEVRYTSVSLSREPLSADGVALPRPR